MNIRHVVLKIDVLLWQSPALLRKHSRKKKNALTVCRIGMHVNAIFTGLVKSTHGVDRRHTWCRWLPFGQRTSYQQNPNPHRVYSLIIRVAWRRRRSESPGAYISTWLGWVRKANAQATWSMTDIIHNQAMWWITGTGSEQWCAQGPGRSREGIQRDNNNGR